MIDKNVLITMAVMGVIGILAINFKQFFTWLWELFLDKILFTLRVDEASQFFYGVQNFLVVERSHRVKNFYYRTIYDNWIDGETTRNVNLFYNRGLIITKLDGHWLFMLKTNTQIQNSQTPYKNELQSFKVIALSRKGLQYFADYVKMKYMSKHIRHFFNNNGDTMLYGNVSTKTFDNIFLNGNQKQEIMSDLDKFLVSKEKYKKLGIKYKRTYLFHGGAGNGKSSLATAIANYTHRDILAINISKDMTDSTLISLMSKRPEKSIVLFEDIDCLFEELNRVPETPVENTENKDKKDSNLIKVTLSCLLNIFDGSFTPDDVIFIITTNHLEKLDSALKRDGRVNMLMEITAPDDKTKAQYLDFLKKNNPDLDLNTVDLDNKSIASLERHLF